MCAGSHKNYLAGMRYLSLIGACIIIQGFFKRVVESSAGGKSSYLR